MLKWEVLEKEVDEGVAAFKASKIINTYDGVASYLKQYGKLPSNYITKSQAEALGW